MRQVIHTLAAAAILLGNAFPLHAQQPEEKQDAFDEIIIRKKENKNTKVTIEIKEGEVWVNGKPIEAFDDEILSVRKRKTPRVKMMPPSTAFREYFLFPEENPGERLNDEGPGSNKALLGVSTENAEEGAKVVSIMEGSAAAQSGLQKGDIITKVNQDKIATAADLVRIIGSYQPEEEVTVTFIRTGKMQKVIVRLGRNKEISSRAFSFSLPPIPGLPGFGPDADKPPRIGIKAQDREDGKGVDVLEVENSSAAENAGIKAGDIIHRFDGAPVNSTDALVEAATAARNKTQVTVELSSAGKKHEVVIPLPKKRKTARL